MVQRIIDNIKGDRQIWLILVIISSISLLTVYSSSRSLAYRFQGGNTEYYLFKHSFILVLSLVITYLAHRVDHIYFSRIAQFMLIISIPLLLYTLFFGQEINDARRWITLPVINLTFQTSDFAKLSLIMYTSRTLAKKQGVIKSLLEGFVPIMLPIGVICGLIMLENMSSALILMMTNLVIMFMGRVSMKYILATLMVGVFVIGIVVGISFLKSDKGRFYTWKSRVEDFVNKDIENPPYQILHSNIAIAKGGLIRFAPGKSTECNFLPEAFSDFIYATIIEEYGLMGGAFIIFIYLWLLFRVIQIFRQSKKVFGALMALGLGFSIVIQAFINMAVVVNILPVTGLTMPFISMGGTSIWFNGFAMGIILSVSRHIMDNQIPEKAPVRKGSIQTELNV